MTELQDSYDVLIAGGGPAGASAAIHLAQDGARVLLVEQKRFPREKLCGEFISPECINHFRRLGVLEQMICAGGAQLTETVFYSERGRKVSVPSVWFNEEQMGAALGLSRAEMDARLLERARRAGAHVLEDTHAHDLITEKGIVRGVRLKESNSRVLDARSLITIDATGRACALVRHIKDETGASSFRPAPNKRRASLVAFKTHLSDTRAESGHCEIYFYRGGYGGLSAVENGLSNLCFIARARDVRECGSDPLRVMREIVCSNERARHTLAQARAASAWLSVSLEGFGRRRVVPARGLLTVGDAASFIDPFTGSGMLMALESGELAARAIARRLAELRHGEGFDSLAREYRALYEARFNRRLRISALLRRAAFVPGLAATAISLFATSDRLRRRLAQATRNNAKGRMRRI
ncbi:MAG: FAD-dependent monooxygenase [Pyrinomonadaceae bacterium]|nr:FAD-dependent monooxygenase [Pyrinomonadaceae bacterium]